MRALAPIGLWLYGAANILAGTTDLVAQHVLPVLVALGLVAIGVLLIAGGLLALGGSRRALGTAVLALALAFALAVFNEQVLGFGRPAHHVVRAMFTAAIVWALWRASAPPRSSTDSGP